MFNKILVELGITSLLCFGERMLERFMFPGLHRTMERMTAPDPARADDILAIVGEALALLAIVWLFNGTLYAIGYLTRRPLKPQVPTLVAVVIVTLTFAGAYGQWLSLPVPPSAAASVDTRR